MIKKMDSSRTIRMWLLCLVVGMLAIMMTACGNSDNGNAKSNNGGNNTVTEQPTADDNNNESEPKTSNEKVDLVIYTTAKWTPEAFDERFGNAMREKFPQYNIKSIIAGEGTALDEMMVSGQSFDIYWQDVNHTIPDLIEYDMALDMTDLIKKHGLDLSTLEQTAVNAAKDMSGDGKIYAIPLVNNTAVLYYNKDIFDKLALDDLRNGMTWDEVLEVADKLYTQYEGEQYLGLRGGTAVIMNLNQFSIPFIDPETNKPTINTDERWKLLADVLIRAKKSMDYKGTSFVSQPYVGMSLDLANIFVNNDMTHMNWDVVTAPTFKDNPGVGPQAMPTMFGITSMSKHPDEAMEVLAYMLSEEVQLSLSERGVIPILQDQKILDAFGTKSNYPDQNLKSILETKFAPLQAKTQFESQIQAIYAKTMNESMFNGSVDVNTVFRDIEEQINQLIDASNSQ